MHWHDCLDRNVTGCATTTGTHNCTAGAFHSIATRAAVWRRHGDLSGPRALQAASTHRGGATPGERVQRTCATGGAVQMAPKALVGITHGARWTPAWCARAASAGSNRARLQSPVRPSVARTCTVRASRHRPSRIPTCFLFSVRAPQKILTLRAQVHRRCQRFPG